MNRSLLFLGLFLAAAGTASAQRWERPGDEEHQQQTFLLYSPLYMPGADTGRIDVPFRIDLAFFIAARSASAPADRPFARTGEILIEAFDSTGTSAARVIEPIEAFSRSSETVPGVRNWYQGIASLAVPPGNYHLLVEVTDQQSKRTFSERHRTIRVPAQGRGLLTVSTPFFVQGRIAGRLPDTLRLENFGSDYLFGSPASLVFLLSGADTGAIGASYHLALDSPGGGSGRESGPEVRADSAARLPAARGALLKPGSDSAGIFYMLDRGTGATLAALPLSMEELPLRSYRLSLTLRRGTESRSLTERFRALWPDMPVSLRDVDEALDALRFLIPEERIDRMHKGDFEARRDSLEAFWKARNPRPQSALNELEAEYYRRVDHAARTFGTLRQPDGTRTDRGRIYILYGPPSSTERKLNPSGAFREVWTYGRLGRTFVFEDLHRSGNYVLVPSGGT